MLSATYQQSSRFDCNGLQQRPRQRLLWRMNRRRLDVEAWRDAMLAVADRLDKTIGGPSVSLDAPSNHRRTFYAAISRHDLAWMLRLFDFPDPNITSGGRAETTVPLQQLFVLNSEFMVDECACRRRDGCKRFKLGRKMTVSASARPTCFSMVAQPGRTRSRTWPGLSSVAGTGQSRRQVSARHTEPLATLHPGPPGGQRIFVCRLIEL